MEVIQFIFRFIGILVALFVGLPVLLYLCAHAIKMGVLDALTKFVKRNNINVNKQ